MKKTRRSIRLREFDYRSAGAYFVTICVQDRRCLFGEVVDGEMVLNDVGVMVHSWLEKLADRFFNLAMDTFILMPNHCHFLVDLKCSDIGMEDASLSQIVQWLKTMSTNDYIRGVKLRDWPRFNKRLWQRNYFEHVVRDKASQDNIRRYIVQNPACWEHDAYNPESDVSAS
jgi:putative transposase